MPISDNSSRHKSRRGCMASHLDIIPCSLRLLSWPLICRYQFSHCSLAMASIISTEKSLLDSTPRIRKSSAKRYVLVIHGGAGTMSKKGSTPEQQAAYRAALAEALRSVSIWHKKWIYLSELMNASRAMRYSVQEVMQWTLL